MRRFAFPLGEVVDVRRYCSLLGCVGMRRFVFPLGEAWV